MFRTITYAVLHKLGFVPCSSFGAGTLVAKAYEEYRPRTTEGLQIIMYYMYCIRKVDG